MFDEDGYYVWCGSMFRYKYSYYLAYSRWKRELGFEAWVTDSEICLAKTDSLFGTFRYVKTLRSKHDSGFDRSCAHNPTVISSGGRFYMYYMGNDGNGQFWDNRNRQRIGVASASDPEGEWSFSGKPLIDVSENGFDSLMVSNPTVTKMPDGRFMMIYKGVSTDGELPKGGAVVCGTAFSDKPDSGFVKTGKPIMVNPTNGWSVEDPFIWCENGRFYALVKDFQGYFTHTESSATALFESDDGGEWTPSEHPLAFRRVLPFGSGAREVSRLERPQIFFEDGKAKLLICACAVDDGFSDVFSVRIPMLS